MNEEDKFALISRLRFAEKNVWKEYGSLSEEYKPFDLGHALPDYVPEIARRTLLEVANSTEISLHQYPKSYGHTRLLNVLSRLYTKIFNRNVDPNKELLVALGASEAVYCSIHSLVDSGDEVILIEPFFDVYVPLIKMAGGIPKFTALRPKSEREFPGSASDWVFDRKELESLFSQKTKLFILNTPNNPLGKVFDLEELTFIAELCKKWNVLCIADEVYEWMVYKPKEHIRIASLPGMWERTVTIGSAGKTFCVTGWKVGWVYGGEKLITALKILHQTTVYTGCTPLQETVAIIFEKELERWGEKDSYFTQLQENLKLKRDTVVKILHDYQIPSVVPDAGFFLLANWSSIETRAKLTLEGNGDKDFIFTKWLIKNIGLLGIPPTAFYSVNNKKLIEQYVRICFIKNKEQLEQLPKVLDKLQDFYK